MTDPKPVRYVPTISAGNIITIIAALVAGAIGWGTLQSDLQAQDNRLQAVEVTAAQREARIRAVEISQAGISADVRSIQAGIARIESSLDKLVGNK